jgi:hypothetical protein
MANNIIKISIVTVEADPLWKESNKIRIEDKRGTLKKGQLQIQRYVLI